MQGIKDAECLGTDAGGPVRVEGTREGPLGLLPSPVEQEVGIESRKRSKS